jgi:hypothetical protein
LHLFRFTSFDHLVGERKQIVGDLDADDRIAELQLEISRLRRLVTDLLLGKIKLEEAAQSQTIRRVKGRHK